MATSLQLDIVTPERNVYSGPVAGVTLPAWNGQLGVLPDHDTLLALLRGGVATVAAPEGELRFVVGRGFAEIGPTQVTLLTDSCEPAASVDKQQAQADLAAAERELDEANGWSEQARTIEARLEVVRARLEA